MTTPTTDFEKIRRMRRENPKMRERDLANTLEVSEADLVAAECGLGARRIEVRFDEIFSSMTTMPSTTGGRSLIKVFEIWSTSTSSGKERRRQKGRCLARKRWNSYVKARCFGNKPFAFLKGNPAP